MDEHATTEPSLWQQLNTFTNELGSFVVNAENKWVLALFAGFVLGLLSRWLVLQLERLFHRGPEHRLLSTEFQDVVIHYDRNLELLKLIIADVQTMVVKGNAMSRLPSVMHFEKLKMPEDAAIFNEKTLRLIHSDYVALVLRTRIRVRNRNTEADQVIKYMSKGTCDPATLLSYLRYVEKHHTTTRDKAQEAVNELKAWFKFFRRWARRIRKWFTRAKASGVKEPRDVIFEPFTAPAAAPDPPEVPRAKKPLKEPEVPRQGEEAPLGEVAVKRLQEQEDEEHKRAAEKKKKEEDEANSGNP